MVTRLQGLGYSIKQIADAVGLVRTTVVQWQKQGSSPNYEDGKAFVLLYESMFGRQVHQGK